ncbi:hypothetical protein VNO77_43230 [Canavalia gladiata]|uniref:Transmembrane protein n=1 Tax=Canavalia gladiata TaxID=3824 RepID=A0AAN9JWE8_CANGL
MSKLYTIFIALVLASIAIQYGGSQTNPFQKSSPPMLIFITALCSHLLASLAQAQTTLPTTIIFHVSGILASQALLCIFLANSWWCYYIINLLLLLFASLCFKKNIIHLLHSIRHMPHLEQPQLQP